MGLRMARRHRLRLLKLVRQGKSAHLGHGKARQEPEHQPDYAFGDIVHGRVYAISAPKDQSEIHDFMSTAMIKNNVTIAGWR